MSLSDDVDLEELIMTKDDLSGADIKAVCSMSIHLSFPTVQGESRADPLVAEAGLLALRERRMRVTKVVSSHYLVVCEGSMTDNLGLYVCTREGTVQEGREHTSRIVPVRHYRCVVRSSSYASTRSCQIEFSCFVQRPDRAHRLLVETIAGDVTGYMLDIG